MSKDELVEKLLHLVQSSGLDPTASKIENEPVIGVCLEDGSEFFIQVEDA